MQVVTAAIVLREDSVLLARRAPGQKLAGMWEFPGGKVEGDESLPACLARELLEELGIAVSVGEVIAESIYKYGHGEICLVAMRTSIVAGEITPTVHDRVEWVRLRELLQHSLAPADVPIAEALLATRNESEE